MRLSWLDADVALTTSKLCITAVWLFALAMAYPYLPGSETEAFKGVSVLLGLMMSLGASNLVGQMASGLILTYTRTFHTGEFVRVVITKAPSSTWAPSPRASAPAWARS